MINKVIGTCPVCQSQLLATRLTCPNCHTEITGQFMLSKFSYLSKDELDFIETFVIVRGNIKEMEKELNMSYPTVKKYLDNIIRKLGYPERSEPKEPRVDHEAILNKIKNGEINVDEAVDLLKGK